MKAGDHALLLGGSCWQVRVAERFEDHRALLYEGDDPHITAASGIGRQLRLLAQIFRITAANLYIAAFRGERHQRPPSLGWSGGFSVEQFFEGRRSGLGEFLHLADRRLIAGRKITL